MSERSVLCFVLLGIAAAYFFATCRWAVALALASAGAAAAAVMGGAEQ